MKHETFIENWNEFRRQSPGDGRFQPREYEWHQILNDDKAHHDEKDYSPDYLLHCAWAARKLRGVQHHVDFGSYLYFPAIVSAFTNVTYCDIRPPGVPIPGLSFMPADLTKLPFADASLPSVSCLHVIEHVGLGRYGDVIDASGDLKAARELARVLKPSGLLIVVAPMNERPHVTFNSDRYYSFEMFSQMFPLPLVEFSWIGGDKITSVSPHPGPDARYYTGMAVFTK